MEEEEGKKDGESGEGAEKENGSKEEGNINKDSEMHATKPVENLKRGGNAKQPGDHWNDVPVG